jgi:altronate dehydratase large subunit
MDSFQGYVRSDGNVGCRDHILILPLSSSLCPLAERVAQAVPGAVTVVHEFESATSEGERDRVTRTFVGTANSPNVGTCVAIGDSALEPSLLEALAELPRTTLLDLEELRSRERIVDAGVRVASEHQPGTRESVPLERLIVGTECGGSDAWSGLTANPALGVAADWLIDRGAAVVLAETTELIGAEHLLAQRAINSEVAEALLEIVNRYEATLIDIGEDIRGAQPTVGNIEGGLTTIEEKSLGAAKKAGSRQIRAVIEYAEDIPPGAGVVVMDTPGHDIEQMTGMIAGGSQIAVFTTGRGTPTGSAIAPVVKVATNTPMFERLRLDMDVDAGVILAGEPLEAVGVRLAETIIAVASGEQVSAERRGARDFALSRFTPISSPRSARTHA